MNIEKAKGSLEKAKATMIWSMVAKDSQGNLKWSDEGKNLIVNTGLDFLLQNDIVASTLYIGLTDATPTIAAGDTMASHSGWTEVTAYSEAARPAWGQGAASGGVTTNSSAVTFTANGTTNVGGGFLGTNATKGGTAGTLFSVKAASEGNRSLVSADTLDVTISLTVTSS
jgi:hypothetical protein